jgi:ferric-dicitrate binding protein FerR (iron transport regulator)
MDKQENMQFDYNSLIVNYLTDSISTEELEALMQWVESSDENRALFNSQRHAWMFAGLEKENRKTDPDQAYVRLLVKRNAKGTQDPLISNKRQLYQFVRIAASWLVFLVLGSAITMMILRKNDYQYQNAVKITVPLGAKSSITLPDGTKAWLNAGTELTYNQDYGRKKRMLFLTGEAFFDVAKDKSHPFIVNTSDVVIRALGTQFNVKAYPEEGTITTTLVEGKIDVRILRANKQVRRITLSPNEEIVYYAPGYNKKEQTKSHKEKTAVPSSVNRINTKEVHVITNVNTKLVTSWKDSRWIIDREPLGSLVPLLERRYNLKIIFRDEELKHYNFTGTIQNETAEQIMNALRFTAPLEYLISNDTITLSLNTRDKDQFNRIMEPRNH